MRNLAVRLTLAALFVVACGVAAYLLWNNESRARRDSQAFRTFESAARAAEREVLEIRAAQQAYVAAGQGEPFWIQKTAALTATLRETITTLRGAAASPDAQSALDNAASALQDFEQMDRRARDYTRNGQKLLASDLIFADGLEITGGIAGAIDQARTIETQARDAAMASVRRLELTALGAAGAVGVLTALLLAPVHRPAETAAATPSADMAVAPVVAPAPRADPPPAPERDGSADRVAPAVVAAPSLDLSAIAALCGDLARVVDTRALPAILERAANVLDAPGIVLWISDPDGRELSPIVTHGYSQSMVARLGTILGNAQNATASAFRTSLMQTVRADAVSNGAIAAPLVTPVGCVGVMAAEVRHGGEQDPGKLAAAAIVAAQLATLVGPPSTRAQARTEAV
jgi:CHASE3 domain sensor protein